MIEEEEAVRNVRKAMDDLNEAIYKVSILGIEAEVEIDHKLTYGFGTCYKYRVILIKRL